MEINKRKNEISLLWPVSRWRAGWLMSMWTAMGNWATPSSRWASLATFSSTSEKLAGNIQYNCLLLNVDINMQIIHIYYAVYIKYQRYYHIYNFYFLGGRDMTGRSQTYSEVSLYHSSFCISFNIGHFSFQIILSRTISKNCNQAVRGWRINYSWKLKVLIQ